MLVKRKDIVLKIYDWSILVIVFFIPLSQFLSVKLLVITLLFSLFITPDKIFSSKLLRSSWSILIYVSILVMGLLYTQNLEFGFSVIETNFALLAFPLILNQSPNFNHKKVISIFFSFSIGVLLAGSLCLINALIHYLNDLGNIEVFFFYNFTSIINSHPTYFAYYLIFAITYGLYVLNYEKLQFPIAAILVFVLFCFCILLLTGGQTAFIAILFVFAFFILKFFLGQNGYHHKVTFALVSLMLVTILFVNSDVFPQRSQELSDSWERFELWRSAILANSDPIFGVGTGDSKIVLNEYFRRTHREYFASEGLNAHNQFIQILFSNGIFGFLAVIILILRPLYLAFKNNDQMAVLMIFPFLIYGMTEVFLGRYQGVVFFALLHQVFVSHYLFIKGSTQSTTTLA